MGLYTSATQKPKRLDQVRGVLRARHYSLRTERTYVGWIVKFIKFHNHIPENKMMAVKIKYGERELGFKVRSVGGTWNRKEKLWYLPWNAIKALSLQDRVVTFSNNRKSRPP